MHELHAAVWQVLVPPPRGTEGGVVITLLNALLLLAGLPLLFLVGVLAVQALASVLLPRGRCASAPAAPGPRFVVLMPAHDEEAIIAAGVAATLAELPAQGRLLVVADNCSDGTAAVARTAGAEVTERHDARLRGKGYALAHGVAALGADPPEVVIVLDADCVAVPGSLALLAREAHRLQRPVQAMYDMRAPEGAGLVQRMAAFAWDFRTRLRAEGLRRLGQPCQLLGSGMAFPWPVLQRVDLATGHIVEDLKLGLDCAAQRLAPRFLPEALVYSTFPTNVQGEKSQRQRWEHGHMSMVVSEAPRLLWQALTTRNPALLVLTLDMCVPPLALLGLVLGGHVAVVVVLSLLGMAHPWTLGLAVLNLSLLVGTIGLGWWRAGRRWVRLSELLFVPWYILRKLPIYLKFLTRRQMNWIRTRRD
ncbi:MAG: glycosyltransferase family 2 protein [Hydrogenophaga sp.]|nr:glycosyltransferase family 2 protein [Hydrogenophaga sp.]